MTNNTLKQSLLSLTIASLAGCGDNVSAPAEPLPFPATCQEAGKSDGDVKLYVDNDEHKPWTAYCHGGDEYLPSFGGGSYGEITSGGNLRTEFQRIRIDPVTLTLDSTDYTFATNTGSATLAGKPVEHAPLGIAIACEGSNESAGAYLYFVDQPFRIKTKLVVSAAASSGHVSFDREDHMIESWVYGGTDCAFIAPQEITSLPTKLADSWMIELEWVGLPTI
jgi:hypothetical protein